LFFIQTADQGVHWKKYNNKYCWKVCFNNSGVMKLGYKVCF